MLSTPSRWIRRRLSKEKAPKVHGTGEAHGCGKEASDDGTNGGSASMHVEGLSGLDHAASKNGDAESLTVPAGAPSTQTPEMTQQRRGRLEPFIERTASGLPKLRVSETEEADQAFGHGDSKSYDTYFLKAAAEKGNRMANELAFYTAMEDGRCDSSETLSPFVPHFHGIVSIDNKDGSRTKYIKLSNLHMGFIQPRTMDIKMGVRCFEESELNNGKPRADLYQRMAKMETRLPEPVLTPEEHAAGGITKARWMRLRDSISSTQRCPLSPPTHAR